MGKKKGTTVGIVDPEDKLKNDAAEIAHFWKNNSADGIVDFSVPQVIRTIVYEYARKLNQVQPRKIVIGELLDIKVH